MSIFSLAQGGDRLLTSASTLLATFVRLPRLRATYSTRSPGPIGGDAGLLSSCLADEPSRETELSPDQQPRRDAQAAMRLAVSKRHLITGFDIPPKVSSGPHHEVEHR